MNQSAVIYHNAVGILIGLGATVSSYGIGIGLGWIPPEPPNITEALAVFSSYWATYLCVVQSRWNYPIGFVSTLLYAWLFWTNGLYASALTNIYLPIALVYGFFRWGSDGNPRPVSRVKPWDWLFLYLPLCLASIALVALVLLQFKASVGWQDAAILVLTVLAQWLLDNKKLETWVVWAVVNVFALYVYSSQGLWLVVFQYFLFLLNTGWGYWQWNESMKMSRFTERYV